MTALESPGTTTSPVLRRLYLARFGFALVWALIVIGVTGSDIGPLGATLLVLYPLVDMGAAVIDLRSSRTRRSAPGLYANIALSLAASIALALAVGSGTAAVLRVWGVWAIAAGAVQVVVALTRRAVGGQVPMVLSGGISVLAGGAFIGMASVDDPTVSSVAGYAVLGGIFFLVSALRLNRMADDAPEV
jgi:uncharacterized membrane protein HdeD (DUF308 family)